MGILKATGFRPAEWLPEIRSEIQVGLRPVPEIAGRFAALGVLVFWVAGTEEQAPAVKLTDFARANSLEEHLTDDEKPLLKEPRSVAHAQIDTIGWKIENLWALAWILGFDPPPSLDGIVKDDMVGRVMAFVPAPPCALEDFISSCAVRPYEEVDQMEDLFYCAHNAVRSAQLGSNTVPDGFDPLTDGGAIHERRHSLTWALSPGTSWDETDLST